jgi:ectoine hydroxylase-related dioxygenase (phytanoyl-CoA dioxygenase family)
VIIREAGRSCYGFGMLTDRQIEDYRRDGYLVIPRLIDGDQLAELRALTDRIVADARGVDANNELYDLEPSHTAALPRVRRLKPVIFKRYAFFHALVREPKIVTILQQLLGSSIRLYGGKLNMKSASYGSPVEWHQDWAFYPHTNDDVLATGIYLDDCDLDNGPLLVVPGSHHGPTHDHHAEGRFCGAMDPGACGVDVSKAVPLMGQAGSMTIHHARLVHGSALNRSNRQRRLLLHEYAAADAFPLMGVADFDEFNSRMVVGETTNQPRIVAAPVRLPLPPADHQGSIYENQRATGKRFFETFEDRPRAH